MTPTATDLRIQQLLAEIDEWKGDGGRYWDQDPSIRFQVRSREEEIRRLSEVRS